MLLRAIENCPKQFGKRPHRRLVTSRGCEWIRPMLITSDIMVSWNHMTQPPNGISIGSHVFAQLTRAPNIQTYRPRYVWYLSQ